MLLTFQVGIAILILTGGALYLKRSFLVQYLKFLLPLSAFVIFLVLSYWSLLQYRAFQSDPLSQFLVPPHHDIWYFYDYVGTRFFAPWLIGLAFAILIPRIAYHLNRWRGERFFEKEEFDLMALGIFLTGYPGFLVYLSLVAVCGILLTILYLLFTRERAPLYHLWLPLAVFAILLIENIESLELFLKGFNL